MNPAFLRAITDAARYVRRRLPRGNSIELQDLVQVGCERVLRYVPEGRPAVFAFICARDGMIEEARAWANKPRDARTIVPDDPAAYPVHNWPRHTFYDVEVLLDIKRTLLRMPLREAASWYSRHVLDERVGTLGPEFGVGRGSICLYEIAARKKLQQVLADGETLRRSGIRILGTAKLRRMQAERDRYAELRKMGATVRGATRGAKSAHTFATTVRQLGARS